MKNKNNVDLLLGNAIKKARLDKGLTLEEVALKIGYKDRGTISNYENANRSISIPILIKICKALGIDYKELLDEVANKL